MIYDSVSVTSFHFQIPGEELNCLQCFVLCLLYGSELFTKENKFLKIKVIKCFFAVMP